MALTAAVAGLGASQIWGRGKKIGDGIVQEGGFSYGDGDDDDDDDDAFVEDAAYRALVTAISCVPYANWLAWVITGLVSCVRAPIVVRIATHPSTPLSS